MNQAFKKHFGNLKYFSPQEIGFLGRGNESGRAKGLNYLPPKCLWPNGLEVAELADEVRARLGSPLMVLSGYRSPAYNKRIGGARYSQHMEFTALDLMPTRASVRELHALARKMRAEGRFKGGVGLYRSFVHIDVRGKNASWGG